MSHYAVIGDPVSHSKSPLIHRLFAEQTGEQVQYEAIQVSPEHLTQFVADFFNNGGAGLNVTLPHKEAVFALAKNCSERAAQAKAVNTLFTDTKGELCGDNTDGVGLIRDITNNHQFSISDKRVLLLGAGGAVRGSIGPLLSQQPASVFIANRTRAKAEQLAKEFRESGDILGGGFDCVAGKQFDLIINGTAMGISNQAPALDFAVISKNCCCYDMMYKTTEDTAFVSWAKQGSAALAVDGLGMLVEQAAESFAIWRGVRPHTSEVIARLRNQPTT